MRASTRFLRQHKIVRQKRRAGGHAPLPVSAEKADLRLGTELDQGLPAGTTRRYVHRNPVAGKCHHRDGGKAKTGPFSQYRRSDRGAFGATANRQRTILDIAAAMNLPGFRLQCRAHLQPGVRCISLPCSVSRGFT